MKSITTASRSRDYLRKHGWIAEVVEHRSGNFRHDLFGFADVIAYRWKPLINPSGKGADMMAYHPDKSILLVQAYRKGAEKDHLSLFPDKNQFIKFWIESGGKFEHHVWSKDSGRMRNKRKTWKVAVINIG